MTTASGLYFGTQAAWIETVCAWAAGLPQIDRVWIIGSRAKGWRPSGEGRKAVPDLDVGFTMTGPDAPELYRYVVRCKARWRDDLEAQVPVAIDLQYAEVGDQVVWPTIQDHGVLVYQREASA